MTSITFVTSNDNKFREAKRTLDTDLGQKSLILDELQEMELQQIIDHKVRQAYDILKKPVIVEDAGLYVDAWRGFPGPFVKWLQETMGYDMLASILPKSNRRARWVVMVGYYDGKKVQCFEGNIDGTITRKPRGSQGWGFDAWFVPKGTRQTYAEMGVERKMQYSARQQALDKSRKYLQK